MFSHVMLGTNNIAESIAFYDQVMPVLGYAREDSSESYAGYGKKENIGTGANCLWIGTPLNGEPANPGNGVNIALLATVRDQVDNFYAMALKSGGQDEGAPGVRGEVHPNFYAAYVRDPSGNKLVVVCHAQENSE